MKELNLKWNLVAIEKATFIKYCKNCGKNVIFYDSGKKRQNANGKNIYEFAIYKCDNGHTWNKKLSISKSKIYMEHSSPDKMNTINIVSTTNFFIDFTCISVDYNIINIEIVHAQGKNRIDKIILDNSFGISRNKVCKLIKDGHILVNGNRVKVSYQLISNDYITICIDPELL